MASIASVQAERERQIDEKYHGAGGRDAADGKASAEAKAAGLIQVMPPMVCASYSETDRCDCVQRKYRNHRDQTHADELSLDPSTRWTEVSKIPAATLANAQINH